VRKENEMHSDAAAGQISCTGEAGALENNDAIPMTI